MQSIGAQMNENEITHWITRLQRLVGGRLDKTLKRTAQRLVQQPAVSRTLAATGIPTTWAEDVVLAVPNLAKLVGRLLAEPLVAPRAKLLFLASVAYVVLPIDVIPDWLPGLGQLDDLLLVTLGLHFLLNESNQVVVTGHWDGYLESLRIVQMLLRATASGIPPTLLDRLRDWIDPQ